MKKALLLCTGAYRTDGGIAAVNQLTIAAVLDAGYALDAIVLKESASEVDERYVSPNRPMDFSYRSCRGNKAVFVLAAWWAVLTEKYGLIIVDHVNLASILFPLKVLKLCHYAVWLHGVEIFPPRPDFEGYLGLINASKLLANSSFTQKSVTKRYPGLPVRRCELALDPVRHPSVLPVESVSAPQQVSLEVMTGGMLRLDDRVILNVGRMVSGGRYKGQESLLAAFPQVVRCFPGAKLVLAGQGDDMPRLISLARTFSVEIQASICFPGYVPDDLLDLLYQKCYVFAMPSIGEGFGLVYLEAMMRAKACLGGRVDATPYIVQDGKTGLLVDDPRAPEQVAGALNWFLSHPEETRRMGLAGYDVVRSRYLFPHFQERFWDAIQEA